MFGDFILEGVLDLRSGWVRENVTYGETTYRGDILRKILR